MAKLLTIQSGPYKGKIAEILGEFRKLMGVSVFQIKSPMTFDYMKRMHLEGFGPADMVYLGKIDGKTLAINENELKSKEETKPKKEKK
jgi:hypothetical protein